MVRSCWEARGAWPHSQPVVGPRQRPPECHSPLAAALARLGQQCGRGQERGGRWGRAVVGKVGTPTPITSHKLCPLSGASVVRGHLPKPLDDGQVQEGRRRANPWFVRPQSWCQKKLTCTSAFDEWKHPASEMNDEKCCCLLDPENTVNSQMCEVLEDGFMLGQPNPRGLTWVSSGPRQIPNRITLENTPLPESHPWHTP